MTDAQGQYKIIELRPGLYTVTLSLTGFSTVKREAIELTAGFTAVVNLELHVGAIEETVTAGASSLAFSPGSGQYTYVWKTDKAWAGQCRTLVLGFGDGTQQSALFQFK